MSGYIFQGLIFCLIFYMWRLAFNQVTRKWLKSTSPIQQFKWAGESWAARCCPSNPFVGSGDGVQSLSHFRLFATPWTAVHQASLSFSIWQSLLKLLSTESVMPSNHVSSIASLSFGLHSFSASGCFPMSRLFTPGGQSFGASTSAWVLLTNIQGWFPLGLTGLIFLQSKGLSSVFSSTTVWKH